MLHSLLVPSSAQDVQRNLSMSKKQDARKLSENTESHEIQEVSTIVQNKAGNTAGILAQLALGMM
jgi:hypothetical protein